MDIKNVIKIYFNNVAVLLLCRIEKTMHIVYGHLRGHRVDEKRSHILE